ALETRQVDDLLAKYAQGPARRDGGQSIDCLEARRPSHRERQVPFMDQAALLAGVGLHEPTVIDEEGRPSHDEVLANHRVGAGLGKIHNLALGFSEARVIWKA